MSALFFIWWMMLIFAAVRANDIFFSVFVFTQFLFVGLGVILFSVLPLSYLQASFSDFDFSRIDASDFDLANLVVLTGVTSALLSYSSLRLFSIKKAVCLSVAASKIRLSIFPIFVLLSIAACGFFIKENASSFFLLALAEQSDDLAGALELRQAAVSDYLITLMIYNFCPATAIIWAISVGERPEASFNKFFFFVFVIMVIFALLLTFQKRPLIVFLFAVLMALRIRNDFYVEKVNPVLAVRRFISRSSLYFLMLFFTLFILYFLYTGYRFNESGFFHSFISISEIIGTRVVGRLSIPAVMYVDFFPSLHDHYWFNNVGIFSMLFGNKLTSDTAIVFANYTYSALDGSMAASVFTDAYGQGGLIWVPIVGGFVGVLLFSLRQLLGRARVGASKLLLTIFGIMYLYYLSQSSLFRASLGYGGVVWLAMWFIVIRNSKKNEHA